jgi:hypothetical protein
MGTSVPGRGPEQTTMAPADVVGRQQLFEFLQLSMQAGSERWNAEGMQRKGEGRAKAYLLDVHVGAENAHENLLQLFRGAADEVGATVNETRDSQFFRLARGNAYLFLEAIDPRFVVAHTTSLVDQVDALVERLTDVEPSIDSAWLSSPFLLHLGQSVGRITARTTFFDSASFWQDPLPDSRSARQPDDENQGGQSGQRFEFSAKGENLNATAYEVLKASPEFAAVMGLSRVEITDTIPGDHADEPATFVSERVYKSGKVTGVGTSAERHLAIVDIIRNSYAYALRRIEASLALGATDTATGAGQAQGHPITIQFSSPRNDLGSFCKRMFSAKKPFLLWGKPNRHSDEYFTIRSLDLHMQQSLYFEMTPRGIRVYLPAGGCANTVARLYSNVLSYVDGGAEIWGRGARDSLLLG